MLQSRDPLQKMNPTLSFILLCSFCSCSSLVENSAYNFALTVPTTDWDISDIDEEGSIHYISSDESLTDSLDHSHTGELSSIYPQEPESLNNLSGFTDISFGADDDASLSEISSIAEVASELPNDITMHSFDFSLLPEEQDREITSIIPQDSSE